MNTKPSSPPQIDRKPQISVIIPAFRARDFICRAIDSALAQSGIAVEVVVIDDASPDDTAAVVAERYHEHPDVRVIRLAQNAGPGAARNEGLRAARASWAAVLDADDAFEPGRLARLLGEAERREVDIIADNVRFYDACEQTVSEPKFRSCKAPLQLTLQSFTDMARPHTGELDLGLLKPMFRRAFLFEKSIFYPEQIRHGEDFNLSFEVLLAGAKFTVLPESGYLWTLRNSGQSQTREDYLSQRREALRIAGRPEVRGDPRLVQSLKRRAKALKVLHYSRQLAKARHDRRYGKLAVLAMKQPWIAKRLAQAAVTRLTSSA